MKTLDLFQQVNQASEQLATHAIQLERQNAMLKKVIRLLAKPPVMDQEGVIQPNLTEEEADLIKRVCDEEQVFLTGGWG